MNKNYISLIIIVGAVLIGIFSFYSLGSSSASLSSGAVENSNLSRSRPQNQNKKVEDKNPIANVSLNLLDGGTIKLSDYEGKKPVIVDFWASWCHNCRRDMPVLNRLYEKYKDDVEVVAINLQETESAARKYIEAENFSFKVAMDPQGQAARAFGVRYTNTHVMISKDGSVTKFKPGDVTEADFVELIEGK